MPHPGIAAQPARSGHCGNPRRRTGAGLRVYYDSVFRRYALRDEMLAFFGRYDALLSPTLPISNLEAGRDIPAGFEHRNLVSWGYYTHPFNLTGQPAASLPVGLSSGGAPVGLQIVTARNDEESALKIAACLEGETAAQPKSQMSRG